MFQLYPTTIILPELLSNKFDTTWCTREFWTVKRRLRYLVKRGFMAPLMWCKKKKTWRETCAVVENPSVAFQARATNCTGTFPIERFHDEGWKWRIRETGNKIGEGLKSGVLCALAPFGPFERRTVSKRRAHTTLYLFNAARTRAGCVRFPRVFDEFRPKFSAGTFSSPPTDLHNILEILYKISLLSLTAVSLARVLAIVLRPDRPLWRRRRQMGEFYVDREESAQKTCV